MMDFTNAVGEESPFVQEAREADRALDDVRERLIVDLCIHAAVREQRRYRLTQSGAFDYPSRMGYTTFEAWLRSSHGHRSLFGSYRMTDWQRYGHLFGVVRDVDSATPVFLKEWPERLRRVVTRINEDEMMAGLPPVELIDAFDEGKFEFRISFVVPDEE